MSYYVDVRHEGLSKFRRVTGNDRYVVEQKARAQLEQWNEMWTKRENAKQAKESYLGHTAEAIERTKKANEVLKELDDILIHALEVNDAVDWEKLKLNLEFKKPPPKRKDLLTIPREPNRKDKKYQPNLLLQFLSFLNLSDAIKKKELIYKDDFSLWSKARAELSQENSKIENENKLAHEAWEKEKEDYLRDTRQAIDNQKKKYFEKDSDAITDYCDIVLTNSNYPDFIPREFEFEYNPANGILIVEYRLPDTVDIPTLKEVKYIKSQDVFKESCLSDSVFNKMYDSLIYKICLRTVHELFEADAIDAIKAIVFNGWVKSTNKATGKETDTCIISVQTSKVEFLGINLKNVDAKVCFKNLKGVGSSQLHGIVAIQPILTFNKDDKRFIVGREIENTLFSGENIAAMPWEDFEHLIRELFEKEFNKTGGEVRVTRASRDGGVDAVAFDPDPIRGGKIVIQAKRYTNTVGVSAVRDLYGTVINEGANKGILISTADYGPDAYEFARGKPLTLLNGGHLLSLLQKHGHAVKIDLVEAKKILKEQELASS